MSMIFDQVKAILLVLVFVLSVSVPVFAEDDQAALNADLNTKKIESAKALKHKVFENDTAEAGANSLASENDNSIVRLFQGLGLCIAAFLVGVHVYKKYVLKDKVNSPKSLKIEERIALNGKSQLCIVRFNDKRILLAVGPDKVSFFQDNDILNSIEAYNEMPDLKAGKELCSEKVN